MTNALINLTSFLRVSTSSFTVLSSSSISSPNPGVSITVTSSSKIGVRKTKMGPNHLILPFPSHFPASGHVSAVTVSVPPPAMKHLLHKHNIVLFTVTE